MTRRKKKVNQKKKKNIFISIIKGLVFGVFWIIASAWKVLIWIAEHVLKLIKEGRTGKEPNTRLFRKPEYESFIELKTFEGELKDFNSIKLSYSGFLNNLVFGSLPVLPSLISLSTCSAIHIRTFQAEAIIQNIPKTSPLIIEIKIFFSFFWFTFLFLLVI